jgi:DUF971 family protein
MAEHAPRQEGREPAGFVVWDQRGLVVVWPDHHRSRFSWEALRQVCLCAECRGQRAEQESVSQHCV